MLNQITSRIGASAEQAGVGSGYGGDSPGFGVPKDIDELCMILLRKQLQGEVIEAS